MFVPDEREHPFITAVRLILKVSRWPADFPDKWDKFPRCFTLSPAGVGSSDGGVVKFGFKWGFHGLPPDFRSPPCIYPNWPMFPPACWPCLYVNRTKRGPVHSEVSEVPSVGRRSSVSHALSSSPSARHFSPLPFVVVFYHHLAVWGIYVTDTPPPPPPQVSDSQTHWGHLMATVLLPRSSPAKHVEGPNKVHEGWVVTFIYFFFLHDSGNRGLSVMFLMSSRFQRGCFTKKMWKINIFY